MPAKKARHRNPPLRQKNFMSPGGRGQLETILENHIHKITL